MKKMLVIIIILAFILLGMITYRSGATRKITQVTIDEINNIEEYISKIYLWKEITNQALSTFEDINNAPDEWLWEVVKKNVENYESSEEEIQLKAKEIFGINFNKAFPKENCISFEFYADINKYLATETILDEKDDSFLINKIEKTNEGYSVEIIEYLADYSVENNIIIRNLNEQEVYKADINENEAKIQEIIKTNIESFTKKNIELKLNEEEKIIVTKIS